MIFPPQYPDDWKSELLKDLTGLPEAPLFIARLWRECEAAKSDVLVIRPAKAAGICKFPVRDNPAELDAEAFLSALVEAEILEADSDLPEYHFRVVGLYEANAKMVANWKKGKNGGRPRNPKPQKAGLACDSENPKAENGDLGFSNENPNGEKGGFGSEMKNEGRKEGKKEGKKEQTRGRAEEGAHVVPLRSHSFSPPAKAGQSMERYREFMARIKPPFGLDSAKSLSRPNQLAFDQAFPNPDDLPHDKLRALLEWYAQPERTMPDKPHGCSWKQSFRTFCEHFDEEFAALDARWAALMSYRDKISGEKNAPRDRSGEEDDAFWENTMRVKPSEKPQPVSK